jgi:hypothetical protein
MRASSSATILIMGAEVNAEMDQRCGIDRWPIKPLGKRGAVVADTFGKSSEIS